MKTAWIIVLYTLGGIAFCLLLWAFSHYFDIRLTRHGRVPADPWSAALLGIAVGAGAGILESLRRWWKSERS